MRKWIGLALVLVALGVPAWAIGIDYDGSADPATVGWFIFEGKPQAAVVDVDGEPGNKALFVDDTSATKTKYVWGTAETPGAGDINLGVGAYLESRIKSAAFTGSETDAPYNLGMYLRGTDASEVGHMLTIRPDRLLMNGQQSSPAVYMGDFTGYHTYRLVYKYKNLPIRNEWKNAWAVYMDGAETPVLHALNNTSTSKHFCSPLWGAGNTGTIQQLYFDYVSYRDTGAYPPGMDGTVQFVGADPDGLATEDNMAFKITWKTNVPTVGTIHYSPVGDNSFSTVFTDPDPTPKTDHLVTVIGATPGNDYEYYVVSTAPDGKKAISLPAVVSLPCPFFIATDPVCTVSSDLSSVTISWTTSLNDSTSELHYGTDGGCSTVIVEPGGGGTTAHSITVPALGATKYYYYVVSNNATWPAVQSSVRNFYVTGTNLINAGFEEGTLDPWVKFAGSSTGSFDGLHSMDYAFGPHSGATWAGSAASYDGTKDKTGIYQTLVTTPGTFYEAKTYIWCRHTPSTQVGASACRIGIDPAGGTDPAAESIVWSNFTDTASANIGAGGPWTEIGIAAKATGTRATVFLQQQHLFAIEWNITGFDDVSWTAAPPPPSTIALTRQVKDGYPASLQGKVVTGYFEHPDSFLSFFYIEETDRSGGIKVITPDNGWGAAGDIVNVEGSVWTIDGEKVIVASSVESTTPSNPSISAPLGVVNKTIMSSFKKTTASCQGLRVKTTGRVTYTFLNMMYVDDGSQVADGTPEQAAGVRVYCSTGTSLDALLGKYIAVTGCLGNYVYAPAAGSPVTVPVIWCDDYQILNN